MCTLLGYALRDLFTDMLRNLKNENQTGDGNPKLIITMTKLLNRISETFKLPENDQEILMEQEDDDNDDDDDLYNVFNGKELLLSFDTKNIFIVNENLIKQNNHKFFKIDIYCNDCVH